MFHFVNCTLSFFFLIFFISAIFIIQLFSGGFKESLWCDHFRQTEIERVGNHKQAGSLSVSPTQTFHGHFRYTVGSGYEIGLVRRSVRCRALETNLSVKAPDFNYIFIPGTLLTPNSIDLCLIFPAECMKENSLLPFYPFRVAPWLLIKKGT